MRKKQQRQRKDEPCRVAGRECSLLHRPETIQVIESQTPRPRPTVLQTSARLPPSRRPGHPKGSPATLCNLQFCRQPGASRARGTRANACASSRPETPSQVSAFPSSGQEPCPQRCQADTLAGQGQSPRCSRSRSVALSRAGNLAGGPEEEGIHYQLLLQEGNKVNQMAQTARPTGKLSVGALCWQNCRAAGSWPPPLFMGRTPQGSLWGEGVIQSTRPRASSDLTCCAPQPP